MYVDKQLRSLVQYKFGYDSKGKPVVQVSYKGSYIALLFAPTYEYDVEALQRHIYSVVRSYIKMTELQKSS